MNSVLVARLERLYQESLGDLRNYVAELAQQFQRELERQDERAIREARSALLRRLEELGHRF